jgi:hypothetical protein
LLLAGMVLGVAFLTVYAVGFWFIFSNAPCGPRSRPCQTPFQQVQLRTAWNMLTLAGLYVANFLTVMTAVLLPVDTLSGEIASGVAQTLASKPIRRAEIVVGKWVAYLLLVLLYLGLMAGGVIVVAWTVTRFVSGGSGFVPPGVRNLRTCLGGWVEQMGEVLVQSPAGRDAIRNIGTIVGLAIPADALWRRAAYLMMPPVVRDLALPPFASMFPPSGAIVIWGAGYVLFVLAIAVRQFERRAL